MVRAIPEAANASKKRTPEAAESDASANSDTRQRRRTSNSNRHILVPDEPLTSSVVGEAHHPGAKRLCAAVWLHSQAGLGA